MLAAFSHLKFKLLQYREPQYLAGFIPLGKDTAVDNFEVGFEFRHFGLVTCRYLC